MTRDELIASLERTRESLERSIAEFGARWREQGERYGFDTTPESALDQHGRPVLAEQYVALAHVYIALGRLEGHL